MLSIAHRMRMPLFGFAIGIEGLGRQENKKVTKALAEALTGGTEPLKGDVFVTKNATLYVDDNRRQLIDAIMEYRDSHRDEFRDPEALDAALDRHINGVMGFPVNLFGPVPMPPPLKPARKIGFEV